MRVFLKDFHFSLSGIELVLYLMSLRPFQLVLPKSVHTRELAATAIAMDIVIG
jgi:hypothetical protein